MSLLLETHALLWWLAGDPIAEEAAAQIADPDTLVAVSAASAWEIAIKAALGKVRFEGSITEQIGANGFQPLPMSVTHTERAGALPPHHHDPFQRMLVAQAQSEQLTIVTRDPAFAGYDVRVLAC